MQILKPIMKLKNLAEENNHQLQKNPVCNGYSMVSELNDLLQSGYYESPLR